MTRTLHKDYNLEIAKGNIPGHTYVHKFGEAGDIDTADGFCDIWDGCSTISGITKITSYTYSSSADIDSLVSSGALDAVDIEIQGLDSSWNLVSQEITLNGQTRVALDTDLIRVFRMKNIGATALTGDVFCYVNGGGLTAGVQDTEADIRSIIQRGNEQTLMAIYTIPNGKTGYLDQFYSSIASKITQASHVHLFVRPTGGVFQIKNSGSVSSAGTSHAMHLYKVPERLAAKSDIVLRADSSVNNGVVSGGFDTTLVDN